MVKKRVRIFDRNNSNPVEISTEILSLEMSLLEATEAEFAISLSDPKLTKSLIRNGNIVLIDIEHYPGGTWGGRINVPETWRPHDGKVILTAVSPHIYLDERYPHSPFGKSKPAGEVFKELVARAKKHEDMPILVLDRNISNDRGILRKNALRDQSILANMQRVAANKGFDFWFVPRVIDGQVQFLLHWEKRKEVEGLPIFVGGKGGNAEWGDNALVVSGKITTAWHLIEEEHQRGEGKRKFVRSKRPLKRFGLREGLLQVEKIGVKGHPPEMTRAIENEGGPDEVYWLRVRPGELSKNIRLGSIHRLVGAKVGFTNGKLGTDTTVRVTDFGYVDERGYLDVLVEVFVGKENREAKPR